MVYRKWYIENGGYIHPSIFRKRTDNGYYAMYTTKKIEKDTIIIKHSTNATLSRKKDIKTNNIYIYIKNVITLLLEFKKGKESKFFISFKMLPTFNEVKNNSIMFCSDDILKKLKYIGYNFDLNIKKHIKRY